MHNRLEERVSRIEKMIKNEQYDYESTSDACWDISDRLSDLLSDTRELVENLQLDGEDEGSKLLRGWKRVLSSLRQANDYAIEAMRTR
jgi:signal transduction histidine kinase